MTEYVGYEVAVNALRCDRDSSRGNRESPVRCSARLPGALTGRDVEGGDAALRRPTDVATIPCVRADRVD